jgi:hypothetical protein
MLQNIITCFETLFEAYRNLTNWYIWWVKTKELELNHYIELREEFDHLKQKLDMRNADSEGPTMIQSACLNFPKTLTNQVLVQKYHWLLVQVRFHES